MEQGECDFFRRKRSLAEVADGAAVVAAPEVKKQLKNPLQVQILEDAYAVTSKPSTSMKEDLARKTGLDYKQVQCWFGNKRYLNKHGRGKCRTRFVSDEILDDQRYGGHGEMSFESGLNFNCISIVSPSDGASLIPSLKGGEASFSWRNSRQKSPEPIEPQLHQSPVISQLLLSPKMMQPHPFTLSFEEMQQEVQQIVTHVEKQLGQPLTADGPILGVEFSPLSPSASDAPKAKISAKKKASSKCCNGQVNQRTSDETIKDLTFLNESGCTSVSSLCNGKAVVGGRVHEHCTDVFSSPMQQQQNYSTQSNKHENSEMNHHAHFHAFSANAGESSKPSNCSYVDLDISSEDQRYNATHKQQEVMNDNIHFQSISAQNSSHLVPVSGKKHDGNPCRIQNRKVFPLGSPIVSSIPPHGQTSSSKNAPCWKPRNLAKPGAGTNYIAAGTRENQDFTVTVSCEVKNYCNDNVGNQSTSNRSIGLTSWHADEHFFVRPRKRYRSNHFSDHNGAITLIAEWKENKKKAVYFVVDNEINSSDSSGTNSTHSERFKDHETVDVVCSISGLNNYDNKDIDAGKNLNGNKGMPSGYNNEYNGQEIYKNCKDEG